MTSADPPRPPAQLSLTADALTFAEVSKDPKGLEWLWSPQVVALYNRLLQRCELNRHTTEAAAGALQNITAGDRRVRWPGTTPGHALRREALGTQGVNGGQEPALPDFTVHRGARTSEREREAGRMQLEDATSAPGVCTEFKEGAGRVGPGGSRPGASTGHQHPFSPAPLPPAVGGHAEPAGSGAGTHPEPAAGPSSDG